MDGYERYSRVFIERAERLLDVISREGNEAEQIRLIFGIRGTKNRIETEKPQSYEDQVFSVLATGFFEIATSFFSLKDIETYIGRFPYTKADISKVRHLRYHIESYLNEVYLLQERFKAYLKRIERLYRKDTRSQEVKETTRSLLGLVGQTLGNIVSLRSTHVHERRFTDSQLETLDHYELFATQGGEEFAIFKVFFDKQYRAARGDFRRWLKANNKRIEQLLDKCFGSLRDTVCDTKGEIRFPTRHERN